MRHGWGIVVILAAAVMGCDSKLHNDNVSLYDENAALRQRNAQVTGELNTRPTQDDLAALQAEIARRDAEINALQGQLRTQEPGEAYVPGIEGIETSFDAATGEMTVRVPGDVLFDSGKAELKPSAKGTLNKIATALKSDYAGRQIRVEGHTDRDPISKTKNTWQDNRDLSLSRAYSVTNFLEQQGVEPARLATVGHGQYKSRGGAKAADRRVEIVVVMR